jgi:hypothetical protein
MLTSAASCQIVSDINQHGYGMLPDFLTKPELAKAQAFARSKVTANNSEYMAFEGPDILAGSGLDDLYRSKSFNTLIKDIYRGATGAEPPDQDVYLLLRCLIGKSSAPHSWIFHYDSYVITCLLPIAIPDQEPRGDLIMFPNFRKIRRTYWRNVVDKILLDNKITQSVLKILVRAKLITPVKLHLVPGNIYFFWGYRSIHTNEPCLPEVLRATALYHFGNPHRHYRWRKTT